MPVAENTQPNLLRAQDLRHADRHGLSGHRVNRAVQIADRVGGARLAADGQNTRMQRRKLVRRQLVLRLVERQMTVDANAAKGNIHTTQLVNHLRDVAGIVRIGENTLILRHHQFRIDFAVNRTVHEPVEGQRAALVNPFLVVRQILVHVDEPAVFQAQSALVHQPHENRILPHRPDRADEHRATADGVVLFDFADHFQRQLIKHLAGITQFEQRHLGVLAQLFGGNLIVIHVHSFLLLDASSVLLYSTGLRPFACPPPAQRSAGSTPSTREEAQQSRDERR